MPKALILYKIKKDYSPNEIVEKLMGKPALQKLLSSLQSYYIDSKEKARARIVRIWMNNIKAEKVVCNEPKYPGNRAELLLEYQYSLKYPSSLGSIRKITIINIPVAHYLWLRRKSPLLVFMDIIKRGLSKVLIEALSYAIYGRPDIIQPLSLKFEDFESIEAWIRGEEGSKGFIKRAVFGDTIVEESHLEEVSVKRTPLESQPIFKNVKENSRRWISLTFVTPMMEEVGTRITCKISYNGSMVIYTPLHDLTTLDVFLSKLESILALTH